MMTKRDFLLAGVSAAAVAVLGRFALRGFSDPASAETFEVTKTDAEWQKILTPEQYEVLRKEGTEYPGTSPLLKEHRKGIFSCAGCALPAYSSEAKYDSGTGWPSFYQSLPDAIRTRDDTTLGMARTEVHCRRCGGHFGHIFDDGPQPTGKRHCLDGVALTFAPASA